MTIDRAWFDAHYYFDGDTRADDPPAVRCRRCNEEVGYLTKHAAVRHGDDVEVIPPAAPERSVNYLW